MNEGILGLEDKADRVTKRRKEGREQRRKRERRKEGNKDKRVEGMKVWMKEGRRWKEG